MQFTDTLVEAYERHAQERASNFPDGFKKQEQLEFLKFLNKEQRKTILEIGCGAGWDAQFFQDQGFRIYAIDNAPTMVKLTNDRGIPAQVLDCYELDQIIPFRLNNGAYNVWNILLTFSVGGDQPNE